MPWKFFSWSLRDRAGGGGEELRPLLLFNPLWLWVKDKENSPLQEVGGQGIHQKKLSKYNYLTLHVYQPSSHLKIPPNQASLS